MTRLSLSLSEVRALRVRRAGLRWQAAQAITEFILTVPVVFMVGAGIIHFGLLANAKSNLDYAALMAARIASTQPDFGLTADPSESPVVKEVLRRMSATDSNSYDGNAGDDDVARVAICIDNPSSAVFDDHADASDNISHLNLQYKLATSGASSGKSIQQANVLTLKVAYLYDTGIPGLNIGHPLTGSYNGDGDNPMPLHEEGRAATDPGLLIPNATQGMWVKSTVAVVMQVPSSRNAVTTPYLSSIAGNCPDSFPDSLID